MSGDQGEQPDLENQSAAKSDQQSGNKRSRKAYNKKAKKNDESGALSTTQSDMKRAEKASNPSNSVRFANEVDQIGEEDEDCSFDEGDFTSNFDINKLTNKKKQYL